MAANMKPFHKKGSLQEMCHERVAKLLKKGTWNKCAANPFSYLKEKDANILMKFLLSIPTFIRTNDMRLLFQSGKVSEFDLSTLLLDEEKRSLLRWLTQDVCTSLRKLSVLYPFCDASGIAVVNGILDRCYYLEEFHSKAIIDLRALKNCHYLKVLRLHLKAPSNVFIEEFNHRIGDFVQSTPNLEEFAFCNLKDGLKAYQAIAAILENCPNLISVGAIDSLEALHQIRKTKGAPVKLNLKRCFWGLNECDVALNMRVPKSSRYTAKFPDKIQNAVLFCPNVETLVINVYHESALEHLVRLQHLKSLSLKFNFSGSDNVPSLIFLLRRIGSSLEHLSLDIDDEIPVEVFRDYCRNLKVLQIYGSVVMKDDMELCIDPLQLERVYLWKADSKSLYLLLRHSPNLIELCLGNVLCLDDDLMQKILMNNFMYPQLSLIGIRECLLSAETISRLLNSACNLKELFFGSLDQYKCAYKVVSENEQKVLLYYETFKLKKREFYTFRPDACSF